MCQMFLKIADVSKQKEVRSDHSNGIPRSNAYKITRQKFAFEPRCYLDLFGISSQKWKTPVDATDAKRITFYKQSV